MKVLLIEDDVHLAQAIKLTLSMQWPEGEIQVAATGSSGIAAFMANKPDLLLLDLGLPDFSGFEVLKYLRQFTQAPILILSAHGEEEDKVQGLELGEDDYLTKPFGLLELLARIRALLRRAELLSPPSAGADLQAGELTINAARQEVRVKGELVTLTPVEYVLLYHLVRNAPHVLTHRGLHVKVWGEDPLVEPASLKAFISRLRAKLGDDPTQPHWIETVPHVGYRFLHAPARPLERSQQPSTAC